MAIKKCVFCDEKVQVKLRLVDRCGIIREYFHVKNGFLVGQNRTTRVFICFDCWIKCVNFLNPKHK
jgi:hypothetical protein